MKISEERKQIFLEVVSQTGSFAAGARAASPHCREGENNGAGASSFRALINRDPFFQAQFEEAKSQALATVEDEIHKRAMNPELIPVQDKQGKIIEYRTNRFTSDKLLIALAKKMNRADWGDQKHVTGLLEHRQTAGDQLQLTTGDLLLLDESKRALLLDLLTEINDKRNSTKALNEGDPNDVTAA